MIKDIFNQKSIFFTITISFLICIIFMIISFTILYKTNEKKEQHFQKKIERDIIRSILQDIKYKNHISKELQQSLSEMNFILISNIQKKQNILNNKNLKKKKVLNKKRIIINHLKLNQNRYIFINTPKDNILIFNNKKPNYQYTLIIISIFIISIFILLYFITINKLKPLKNLQKKIENLANEDFDIDCATNKEDEISKLANEFHKTAKKLKSIKESRDIFIRNIMHELKTPITKGKILTQLPQTSKNIETMQKVFYRLESLINEFSNIEELLSKQKILNKKLYYLDDIIDNAIDILMVDESEVIKEFKNIQIDVDFVLFSIAIKNLIDNGIKYSKDKQVKIKTENNSIIFENKGDKLKYPIEKYFEPFFKGDNIKSNQSFGLGLYIVKHIIEANGYKIDYIYKNNVNRFIIM